jgi:predicted GH43/DUF377 family glycosyl hydrolase
VSQHPHLIHYPATIMPDPSRTIARPFVPGYPQGYGPADRTRAEVIVSRILALADSELDAELADIALSLDERHNEVEGLLTRRYEELASQFDIGAEIDARQRLLIGSYFTQEYSFEAAALFNPSAILHPDQSDLPNGAVRLVMSLRAIGEGHVSSLSFRTAVWTPGGALDIDPVGPTTQPPISKQISDGDTTFVELHCGGSRVISETVLFPVTPNQRQGIEDVRLVRFVDDDSSVTYYGTYTAFDGRDARSELLVGQDFHEFQMRPLQGDAVKNKGMALFPRRVGGRYAMLGRQDNENIWLLMSDDILEWSGGVKVIEPRYPWEFVQMGNCGSPIETAEGWLVLTHGVGKIRNYAIGACLLDKNDPTRLLARTPKPILAPTEDQRDGYVPNVVYSCGAVAVGRDILIPYAVADSFTAFAATTVDALLAAMN